MNQSLTYELNQVMTDAAGTGMFSSLASFFDRGQTTDALGQVDNTTLTPVAGLQNIPCQIAPVSTIRPQFEGGKFPDSFFQDPERHVLLNDYYATVQQRYVVNVDGISYEMIPGGVEWDSQKQMTRLAVRRYVQ